MTAVRVRPVSRLVAVTVDGRRLDLPEGEPLATALACSGILLLRRSPRNGAPRGAFCLMGACQECAVHINGELRQACLTPVTDGMVVELRGVP
jgi:predicted molibdopterin-dependent oxidoreductase YjgC